MLHEEGETEVSGYWYLRLRDPAWLHQRYVVDGLSFVKIAREVGCSEFTVRRASTAALTLGP